MQPDRRHSDARTGGHPGAQRTDAADSGDVAATFCATLVDEWVRLGVTDAVVCPGSRNTAISVALATESRIRTQVVHDERSAAFMALGLALATRRPAVLTCTSGSAATHFHPAVVEADMAAVPMLVLTADRPPELQGVLAPQTIDQRDLYGTAVRWYCEPGPPAAGGAPWWRDLARDAMARACGETPGPVQLNLAFREPSPGWRACYPEPEPVGGTDRVRILGESTPWSITDEDVARLVPAISGRRGGLVAGARASRCDEERSAILDFAAALGWPVLADASSGLRVPSEVVVDCFDAILRAGAFDQERPEVVIRLGGLLASKATNQWLSDVAGFNIAVDRHGRCPDPAGVLSQRFMAVPSEVLAKLAAGDPPPAPVGWTRRWSKSSRACSEAVTWALDSILPGEVNEPVAARVVLAGVPPGGSLLVASSMPVRDLEAFAVPRGDVVVHSNRGTNGIDGTLATATGIALGSGAPTVVLCGDVAFLHDVGSLNGLHRRDVDLTIVVIDNDGGGIFGFLPQAEMLDEVVFEEFFGTPHGHDLLRIARSFGLDAEAVGSTAGLKAALAGATARGGVRVVVVRSDRRRNVEVHRRIQEEVNRRLTPFEARRT
ncbi:MAG: 2-succinyl-5-enolpyruvyl-6-hydroxy-3-cyclohexene-1-carboxylic-acid synthase [Microthrixaceae bacterium]|nr:2-succinyl-5-enolpyruvyl-6-hydroxy-3-cyclohexene-1-carboxylic-acid synthase [Microthrixaceae bacterium]